MKRLSVSLLFVLLGGLIVPNAPPAAATDVSFESRTYLPARGTNGEATHALLYEYLALDVQDLQVPGLYLRAGGWGRTDLADETFDRKTNGELQYAFVGWRGPRLNAEGRLGRISLTAGVARNEVFDGALFGSDLPAGFDITLFGGIPVETEKGGRSKDTLYGARISQGRSGLYRIGGSYLKEENAGEEAREEAGVDIFLAPLALLEVSGSSLYNLIDDAWARHDYRLALGPFAQRVRLVATWASTDYRHYFQAPNHPSFVQEPDAEEKLDRLGGEVSVDLGSGLALTGEYTSYAYDVAQSAKAYGARVDWTGGALSAGGGYRQVRGDADEDRYQEYRVYGSTARGALKLSGGVEHLAYEAEINGKKAATTGSLTLGYALSQTLEVSASAGYGVTPDFEREVSGLLAVLWRYDASYKKGGTK